MTEPANNVYSRLARARASFQSKGNFKKVMSEGLRFAYLPVESAKPLIEQCTSEERISIIPLNYSGVGERTHKYTRKTNYGEKEWYFECADIDFCIAGPEDSFTVTIRAEAQDMADSDKVVNKVYTMAYKNLIKIIFGFSESSKDDSKYDDAREQDNDFNQGELPHKKVPATAENIAKDKFFGKVGQ